MTPEEMHRLMKEHHARMHEAISRNILWPVGLSPREKCRIEIVQSQSGAVQLVEVQECSAEALADAVLQAVARTSLSPPLRFPHDPPFTRFTSWLEFSAPEQ